MMSLIDSFLDPSFCFHFMQECVDGYVQQCTTTTFDVVCIFGVCVVIIRSQAWEGMVCGIKKTRLKSKP
jgi:hypothetical protein